MADVVVKIKIMPTGTDINLENLSKLCKEKIEQHGGMVHKMEQEEVAFGLKALVFTFLADEKKINTDKLEADLRELPDVSSVDIIDVRRAFG